MAILKSLKQKSKEFVFKSFSNDKEKESAVIVFNRFPMLDETFPIVETKNVIDSKLLQDFDNTEKAKTALIEMIIDNLMNNLSANRIDYKRFFSECVSHIDNLSYDGNEVKTVEQFFNVLPEEASYTIAYEAYIYAKESDIFSFTTKKN
jgi:hypothetical protein